MENSKFYNTFKVLDRKFRLPIFFIIFFIDLVYHLIVSWLVTLYDPKILETFEENTSLVEIFILSVVVGPLIETFLFQYLIIEILYALKKVKVQFILIISALAFSSSNYYNFIYILVTFTSGLIYASYYLYLKIGKKKYPFIYIWVLHTLYNFTIFILVDILNL